MTSFKSLVDPSRPSDNLFLAQLLQSLIVLESLSPRAMRREEASSTDSLEGGAGALVPWYSGEVSIIL